MSAGCGWAGRRLTLDTPVLPKRPGQHARGRPRRQPLPAGQPHSRHSGSASRGPQSPRAPRCGSPARLGNSLLGRRCLRPSSGPHASQCPGLLRRPVIGCPSAFQSPDHLLTHHHTPGSRCPGGAGQGMGTDWHIPAGGTGCGPPVGGRGRGHQSVTR